MAIGLLFFYLLAYLSLSFILCSFIPLDPSSEFLIPECQATPASIRAPVTHYANNCPKAKKKVYPIEQVPEDSESDSMGDAIREQSDEDQDPREELLVEYQEETKLEIQDIQLEEGMPQDTSNKNLCKHTQDAQTSLVTPTKGKEYTHGTAKNMTVCIENSQHPFIIDSGAHCSIVARNYLDHHFPNWKKQL
ncbi:hypothetical protein O181_028142 [Austropuccinia psidii MF-1]|uniref:Uncharacterized protein n=1 Tax=Austropuccinia psidii MF-1 TaxID=1389203 RepID=A0A9Q3H2B5_9BASI|nr:hypothetical protein [Austropuccinia psidii MF-1]